MVSFNSRDASEFYATAEREYDVRKYVRRDVETLRRHPENEDVTIASTVSTLLQRVAGTSIQEIEVIIVELKTLRLRLTTEVARVQREIIEYATLSQAAIELTKIIAENISSLRTTRRAKKLKG